MLGRVRFEELKEDEDIIGEGTFGTVLSGTYGDTEVAIKKARDFRGSKEVIEAFRWGEKRTWYTTINSLQHQFSHNTRIRRLTRNLAQKIAGKECFRHFLY